MTNKEKFIEDVENVIEQLSEQGLEYFNQLKEEKAKSEFTEKGQKILIYMQNNYKKYNNIFKAKVIGEGLFMSGRSVSGSIRKLITDGYIAKNTGNPVTYSLTDLGKEYKFDNN